MDGRQEKIVFLKKRQLLIKSEERRCVLSTKIWLKRAQQLQYKVKDCAAVAQWIEYWPPKPRVVGSIPASRTNLTGPCRTHGLTFQRQALSWLGLSLFKQGLLDLRAPYD